MAYDDTDDDDVPTYEVELEDNTETSSAVATSPAKPAPTVFQKVLKCWELTPHIYRPKGLRLCPTLDDYKETVEQIVGGNEIFLDLAHVISIFNLGGRVAVASTPYYTNASVSRFRSHDNQLLRNASHILDIEFRLIASQVPTEDKQFMFQAGLMPGHRFARAIVFGPEEYYPVHLASFPFSKDPEPGRPTPWATDGEVKYEASQARRKNLRH